MKISSLISQGNLDSCSSDDSEKKLTGLTPILFPTLGGGGTGGEYDVERRYTAPTLLVGLVVAVAGALAAAVDADIAGRGDRRRRHRTRWRECGRDKNM